jgi:hypothetical protein
VAGSFSAGEASPFNYLPSRKSHLGEHNASPLQGYPASTLAIDEQGKFHYDLAGNPWPLVNVFDSNSTPELAERQTPDGTDAPPQHSLR